MGAAPAFDWDPDGTLRGTGYDDCAHGWSCRQGLLAMNECKRIANATDGTSNTIIVAEQSGLTYPIDVPEGTNRTSNYMGGWFGARRGYVLTDTTSCGDSPRDHWQTGTTCVRQPPNARVTGPGNAAPYRNNTTINSFHTGGVFVAMGDGSVTFVSDSINFQTLKKLAMANDGQVVGEF